MRSLYHPHAGDVTLSDVLYALSDPIRFRIVQCLAANGEQACGTFGMQIAKPTLSHHFKVLREAGLMRIRCDGTQRLNSLRRDELDARFPGLLDAVLHASAAQHFDRAAHGSAKQGSTDAREPEPVSNGR